MTKLKQTKRELISRVYENTSFNLKDVSECVGAFLAELTESLSSGKSVELRGFGTFEVKMRGGGRSLNFRTGEVNQNQDYCTVVFRPGKMLKEKLNEVSDEETN